jgi:hypothetical protein
MACRNLIVVGFPAQRNHRYEVSFQFDNNANSLAMPPPKIQIELDSFVKEDLFIVGAVLDFIAVVLCLIGVGILTAPFLIARVRPLKTSAQAN